MPIYEYRCRACEHRFEQLVLPSSTPTDEGVACPSCRGRNLERLLSLFAVESHGTRQAHLKQARKIGEKAARDTRHSEMEEIAHIQKEHE
jgi:putative FmdB family regulatory protein